MAQRIESDYGIKLDEEKSLKKEAQKKMLKTFEVDEKLPALPVADLNLTLDKYLDSIRPFVNDSEFKHTRKLVEDFRNGLGKKLHSLLTERAKKLKNWLEEYWLDYAYLELRVPIAPFINTAGILVGSTERDFSPKNTQHLKINAQLANASILLHYYSIFFDMLRNESYPAQTSRSQLLSMDQFRRLFNTCRVPGVGKDRLCNYFKTAGEGQSPTYALVIYKQRFFKLELYKEKKLLNMSEFYKQLESMVERYESEAHGVGIGALTADYRDSWANNREYLLGLSERNRKSFETIDQSVYAVVLDDCEVFDAEQTFLLGETGNAKNRFFDKSYQAIVSKNGRVTSNTEHSAYDGMASTSLILFHIEQSKKDQVSIEQVNNFQVRGNLDEIEEIIIDCDLKIEGEIKRAAELFEKFSFQLEFKVLTISSCNKELIKSYKINPDTFSQMCMQLAYYQLHKKPAPTYETATTRSFYHGRTETVRSSTMEALEWCIQMCNQDKSNRLNDNELLSLFRKACDKHDRLMNEARENAGCDRCLLGLRMISRQLNLELPEIFRDAAWKKSGGDGNFLISSSFLGFTNVLGGCAPMCHDGYTMIYCYSDDGLCYCIGRYVYSKETNLEGICNSLQLAIRQTQKLFETNSKL